MKKFEKIVKKKYDVLIIDHAGKEWLRYCIPKDYTSFVVDTSNAIPFIKNVYFLYNFFIHFFKNRLVGVSLLSAIVMELKPKVIITFIDNNSFMGKLQTIFPEILVISVQNGVRLNDPSFKSCEKYWSFPHYFGFGDHELNMMRSKNANVKEYFSNGSLKMGIFLSFFYGSEFKHSKTKTICLISQYKEDRNNLMLDKSISAQQKICKLLLRFSQENDDIKITVAMRSEIKSKYHQNELKFLRSTFGHDGATCSANDRINMSSYQQGMDSDLIICFNSTLLFELFGAGKKILCCGDIDNEISGMYSDENQYKDLPNEILLNSLHYDEFKRKVSTLLEMDCNSYINNIKDARKYYMNLNGEYPHQAIYSMIQNRCKK